MYSLALPDRELAERMLEENKMRMLEMEKSWEQRLEEARYSNTGRFVKIIVAPNVVRVCK